MASVCVTITVAVPGHQVPKVIRSCGDVEHLYRDTSEGLLSGMSRRNWFQYMMEIVNGHYGVNDLSHFSSPTSSLSPDACCKAAESLENLLNIWRNDPAQLIKLSGQTAYSEQEVSNALSHEINMTSDDGDDILYFIGYLRAHSQFLRRAAEDKLHVLYVQYS